MDSLFITIGGWCGNKLTILKIYNTMKQINKKMAGICKTLILLGLMNFIATVTAIKTTAGMRSGCNPKLSAKFPVAKSKPALVKPHAGQGKPASTIEGQI